MTTGAFLFRDLLDDGINLNFHQHGRTDQRRHANHCGRGTNIAEEFAVRLADLLPVPSYIDNEHACAHNMFHTRAGFDERSLDDLQRLYRLSVGVTLHFSFGIHARRSSYVNDIAHAYGATVSNLGFKWGSTGNVLAHSKLDEQRRHRMRKRYQWEMSCACIFFVFSGGASAKWTLRPFSVTSIFAMCPLTWEMLLG